MFCGGIEAIDDQPEVRFDKADTPTMSHGVGKSLVAVVETIDIVKLLRRGPAGHLAFGPGLKHPFVGQFGGILTIDGNRGVCPGLFEPNPVRAFVYIAAGIDEEGFAVAGDVNAEGVGVAVYAVLILHAEFAAGIDHVQVVLAQPVRIGVKAAVGQCDGFD